MIKKIALLLLIASCFINTTSTAQQIGLHFMDQTIQTNKTNPSFISDYKYVYSLPSPYIGFANSGATFNEIFTTSNGMTTINVNQVIDQLEDNNFVKTQFELDMTNIVVGYKNMQFMLNHSFKFHTQFNYPKSLPELAWRGNAPFIGETVNIAPDLELRAYNEFGLGFAMRLASLNVGGRLKILTGVADISTGNTDASLYTDDEYYQLSIATDYQINMATLVDFGGLENAADGFDMSDVSFGSLIGKNMGIGLDLGATFDLNEKITVGASLVDIGRIKWKNNTYNYHSKGEYTFEGVDVSTLLNEDSIDFQSTIDTLQEVFGFQESRNAYTTALPAKAYVSGSYKITDFFKVGGLLYLERSAGGIRPAYSLNASANFRNIVAGGLTYTIVNNTYNNIGLHLNVKLGPVQLFAVTDNIVSAFKPYDSHNMNARVGINMAFKKRKEESTE